MHQIAQFSRFEDCKRVRVISQAFCPAPQTNPLAILVAENDPCDALLLEQAIFQAGLHVPLHFVTDGQEAIDYLRGAPPFNNRAAHPLPTLLLLELDLPGVSGLEVLEWLQEQSGLDRVQVVILSSCSEREAIRRAYILGADSYLLKPNDRGELVNVAAHLRNYWLEISQVLDHPSSATPVAARAPTQAFTGS